MKLENIDPFIRFAGELSYFSKGSECFLPDCRLHYIVDGEGEIIIKNQHYKLFADSVIFCTSGSIYNIISEKGLNIIALNFDLTKSNSFITSTRTPVPVKDSVKHIVVGGERLDNSDVLSDYCVFQNADIIKEYIFKLLEEYEKNTDISKCTANTYLKLILLMLDQKGTNEYSSSDNVMKRVIKFIDENYKKDIDNRTLASLCGYHEYYFGKMFLKHMGTTPHKYIIKKRLTESKKMLLGSNYTLESIAQELGFSAGTHFSISFKKEYGITPADFRKKHKTNI